MTNPSPLRGHSRTGRSGILDPRAHAHTATRSGRRPNLASVLRREVGYLPHPQVQVEVSRVGESQSRDSEPALTDQRVHKLYCMPRGNSTHAARLRVGESKTVWMFVGFPLDVRWMLV